MNSRHAGQRPGIGGRSSSRKRGGFRAWRRARPFWGGLLMVLAGLELLSIPLSGVLIKGQVKLVIYIGIGGVFGVLIGALLIVAGLVVWVNPTHRVFYGIAGIVLGIISFPASNLGGFFLGMLLAIIGGALAFAWTPARLPFPPRGGSGDGAPDLGGAPGVDGAPGLDDTRVDLPPADAPGRGGGPRRPSGPGTRMLTAWMPAVRMWAARLVAVGAASAAIVAGLAGTGGAANAASSCGILGLLCSPGTSGGSSGSSAGTNSPSTSSPSTSSTSTSSTSTSGSGAGGPAPAPASSAGSSGLLPSFPPSAGKGGNAAGTLAGKTGNSKKSVTVENTKVPSGLIAPSTTSVLTAKSATMTKLNFAGITTLPVGGGGSEKVLEITADSASLSTAAISVTQDGATVNTKTTSIGFPSGMTLYTTKLCGQVEGIAPNLCFTPSTVSAVALKLASVLGKATPITMTNVSADQFVNLADTMQWGPLTMATA